VLTRRIAGPDSSTSPDGSTAECDCVIRLPFFQEMFDELEMHADRGR
jgi:hypothetical protein